MINADDKLSNVREQLKVGVSPPSESVRSFLAWFNVERRGWRVTQLIRAQLEQYDLRTEPDFENAFIDLPLKFIAGASMAQSSLPDPAQKIGRLEAANKPPLFVKPDQDLAHIVTLMMSHNYSQLPVMVNTRDVKGFVSWQTIGSRLAMGQSCKTAKDLMEPPVIVGSEESLFNAIYQVAKNDFVLVRAKDQQISGIVTASDINDQFVVLSEPFLLLGEIENTIRRMLHGRFTVDELRAARYGEDTGREVKRVADLTFGEYVRLIENEANWQKLVVPVYRVEFVKRLVEINEIRNDVMHFEPDGIEDNDLEALRAFAKFLKRLRDIGTV